MFAVLLCCHGVCAAVASVLALAASVNSVHLSQAVSTSTPQPAVHKTNTMYVVCAARPGTGW